MVYNFRVILLFIILFNEIINYHHNHNPNPINFKLLFSFGLIRHGARTNDKYFSKEMFDQYEIKEITQEGQQQMQELGKQTIKILQKKGLYLKDYSELVFNSSPKKRTMISAINYLKGMFDTDEYIINYKELFEKQNNYSQITKQIETVVNFEEPESLEKSSKKKPTIFTISKKHDYYFHAYNKCQYKKYQEDLYSDKIQEKLKSIRKDPDFIHLIQIMNHQYLKKINQEIKIDQLKLSELSGLRDLIITAQFHKKDHLIPQISKDQLRKLMEIKRFMNYEFKFENLKFNQVVAYHTMMDLLRYLEEIQKGEQKVKLVLNSVHDNLIANWLNILVSKNFYYRITHLYQIPYASQMFVNVKKIQDQIYVIVEMNHTKLKLRGGTNRNSKDKYFWKLDQFINKIKKIVDIDFLKMCSQNHL